MGADDIEESAEQGEQGESAEQGIEESAEQGGSPKGNTSIDRTKQKLNAKP